MKALKLITLLSLLYPSVSLSIPYSHTDPLWDPFNDSRNRENALICTPKDQLQVRTPSTNVCQEGPGQLRQEQQEAPQGGREEASKILRNDQVREP